MRNSASPRNEPPMPLATWSFADGRVFSPAISHRIEPANV